MNFVNDNYINFISKIEDNSIDLIIVDPPYKVTKRGVTANTSTGGMLRKKLTSEGKIFNHNDVDARHYIKELYRVLKNGSHCYIMTNHINLTNTLNTAQEAGFHFIKSLIWDKGNKIMGQCYMSQFEYILFFRKGKHRKINKCGTSDILSVPNKKTKDCNGKNLHDTEKPVELMKILIENSSNEGDVVMDIFAGIAPVAIACKELNRKFVGCEIDRDYFDIAINRIKQFK